MTITVQVVPESELVDESHDSWHQLADYPDFAKWQYKDSPYRVVCVLDEDRGHWKAVFTTVFEDSYNSSTALIRGNLGGGKVGFRRAKAAARQFIEDNKYGCPPPGEIEI